jgi:DNA-binding YbaB/EbfC family protein
MPLPPNLQQMLQQAQQMQEEMMKAQETLKDERVDASSGGGMVKVVATGDGRLESIEIDPDAVDPEDVELLQDMVLAAANEALRAADELRESKMGGASGLDPASAMEALGGLGGMGGLGAGGGGALPGAGGAGGGNRAARRANKKR